MKQIGVLKVVLQTYACEYITPPFKVGKKTPYPTLKGGEKDNGLKLIQEDELMRKTTYTIGYRNPLDLLSTALILPTDTGLSIISGM